MICTCNHSHEEHADTVSHNYTHGKCSKCNCKYFVIRDENKVDIVDAAKRILEENEVCYKTNRICRYKCTGLCKESC